MRGTPLCKRRGMGTREFHLPTSAQNELSIQEHIDGRSAPQITGNKPRLHIDCFIMPFYDFAHVSFLSTAQTCGMTD